MRSLAFDGDGDRVGLVTNKGEIFYPDKILMMFAKDILSSQKGSIIFDVKCSNVLPEIIKSCDGEPIMSPTGHFHIKNKLRETNALLAGEMSGSPPFASIICASELEHLTSKII